MRDRILANHAVSMRQIARRTGTNCLRNGLRWFGNFFAPSRYETLFNYNYLRSACCESFIFETSKICNIDGVSLFSLCILDRCVNSNSCDIFWRYNPRRNAHVVQLVRIIVRFLKINASSLDTNLIYHSSFKLQEQSHRSTPANP